MPLTRTEISHAFLLALNPSVYSPAYLSHSRFVNDRSGHREPVRRKLAEGSPPCIPYESPQRMDARYSEARQENFKDSFEGLINRPLKPDAVDVDRRFQVPGRNSLWNPDNFNFRRHSIQPLFWFYCHIYILTSPYWPLYASFFISCLHNLYHVRSRCLCPLKNRKGTITCPRCRTSPDALLPGPGLSRR